MSNEAGIGIANRSGQKLTLADAHLSEPSAKTIAEIALATAVDRGFGEM